MEIFTVDIGKGTQDMLYSYGDLNPENWIKAVLPYPSTKLYEKVKRMDEDLRIDGYVMGGGPLKLALFEHVRKGYRVQITKRAAATVKDNLDFVREKGIEVVDRIENPNLILKDLDFNLFRELLRLGGREFSPEIIGVACQDHGFVRGQSDRITRFNYFKEMLEKTQDPFRFTITEKTGFFTRFDSVIEQLKENGFKGFVMDSKIASICGILYYANDIGVRNFIGLDIGNAHTLGVSIRDGKVVGLFEHHTKYLNPEKLKSIVEKLIKGTLTFEEVYEDRGHGAVVLESNSAEKILVAGPNRRLFKDYGEYAYPGGDVMMTGCIGLNQAAKGIVG